MIQAMQTKRPLFVTLISIYFLVAALYLWILAAILLAAPGRLSLTLGSRFMHGLELAGPYMMLLVGSGYALIGWGLFRLHNWARWLALAFIALSIGSLVPVISSERFDWKFFASGIEIAILAAAGFYLAQGPTAIEAFANNSGQRTLPRIHTDLHG